MRVRYCDKVFIFIIVAILLLIDNTNFAKADNYADKFYSYDSYQDPDYQYPDQSSKYSFFFIFEHINFTTSAQVFLFWQP
jgi:hypothetical protein